MSNVIYGNAVGGGAAPLKTLILEDESGNELFGVVTGSEVIFTATDNDVREGMVYASDNGVSIGTNNIPAYRTEQGVCVIFDGDEFVIDEMFEYSMYDYTQLQCIIAPLNSVASASVASDKIVLFDNVYSMNSLVSLATVSKDANNKTINLNITNNSGKDYVIHYFTYREEV